MNAKYPTNAQSCLIQILNIFPDSQVQTSDGIIYVLL